MPTCSNSFVGHVSQWVVYLNFFRAVAGEGIPESYLPKTCVHQWEGHTKVGSFECLESSMANLFFQGVNCIRWLPKWGHLLLSASLDNTVKIWDVYDSHSFYCLSLPRLSPFCQIHALVNAFLIITRAGTHTGSAYARTMATLRYTSVQFSLTTLLTCSHASG